MAVLSYVDGAVVVVVGASPFAGVFVHGHGSIVAQGSGEIGSFHKQAVHYCLFRTDFPKYLVELRHIWNLRCGLG